MSPLSIAALVGSYLSFNVALEATRRYAVRVRRFRPSPSREGSPTPRVLVIRPLCGADPRLDDTLTSLEAEAGLRVACVLTIPHEGDLARPAAERAARALRDRGVPTDVVVTSREGPNNKVVQLARVEAQYAASADVLLVADGDVRFGPGDVAALATEACSGELAWIPPVEVGRMRALGDLFSQALLGSTLHAFPALAGLDRRGLVGKCFALGPERLAALGGFLSLTRFLGEDMELARRATVSGRPPVALPRVVASLAEGRSLGAALSRFARWLVVVKERSPRLLVTYPALLASSVWVLPLALAAATLPHGASAGWLAACLGMQLASRALVSAVSLHAIARGGVQSEGLHGGARGAWMPLRLLVLLVVAPILGELLLFAAFAKALVTRRVEWRGRALTLDATGLSDQVAVPAPRVGPRVGPRAEPAGRGSPVVASRAP